MSWVLNKFIETGVSGVTSKGGWPSNGDASILSPILSFKVDSGMHTAEFKSLKSKKTLEEEISNYLETLSYFVDAEASGYKKDDLTIYSYTVEDKGWFRQILVTYN